MSFKNTIENKNQHKINREINVPTIRLINQNNEMVGIFNTKTAIYEAEKLNMDLVEINPTSVPPVCKILDYGKFKFEAQKKANELRKKQKTTELKEIQFRPGIGKHDFDVKMKSIQQFLEDGNKVKVIMRFKGREMAHQDIGMNLMIDIISQIETYGKAEQTPKKEGKQIMMILCHK